MSVLTLIVWSSLMIPMAMAAIPGTYFWKPRLGLDFAVKTTTETSELRENLPNMKNIHLGLVVMVNGWNAGMTFVAYMVGLVDGYYHSKTLNPSSAYFYTNAWRWTLRFMSYIPDWWAKGANIADATKLWERRFRYQGNFVPGPLRYVVPYVKEEEWEKEIREYIKLKKSALFTLGRFNRYPPKIYNNFTSLISSETEEDAQSSVSSSAVSDNFADFIIAPTKKKIRLVFQEKPTTEPVDTTTTMPSSTPTMPSSTPATPSTTPTTPSTTLTTTNVIN